MTLSDRGWEGFNTDAPAALALIRKAVDPHGCPVAVVGAGGTARAIAAALSGAGAVVTMYNRTMARGEETARAIGVRAAPLGDLPRAAWDVLVQATPIGRHGEELVPRRHLTGRMVLDAAYGAEPTPLVRAARARGLAVADGLDLLEEQANLQFARLTARDAPRDALHNAVLAFRDAARACRRAARGLRSGVAPIPAAGRGERKFACADGFLPQFGWPPRRARRGSP